MRKEYARVLRDRFTDRMRAELPMWEPVKPPAGWYWPGERVFVSRRDGGGVLVVILQPSLKDYETFDVQVGWSWLGRVPELSMRPCMDAPESADAREAMEYVCSLRQLVPDGTAQMEAGVGWVVDARSLSADFADVAAVDEERRQPITASEVRARIEPILDNAWRALREVGIPWLEARLAERVGSSAA